MANLLSNLRCCPNCRTLLRVPRFEFDAAPGCRLWSDGKMDTGDLPAQTQYFKCQHCEMPFHVAKAVVSDPYEPGSKQALLGAEMASNDYDRLANGAALGGERAAEVEVRLAWWRHLNDGLRGGHTRARPRTDRAWAEARLGNLRRLVEILAESDKNEWVSKAESLRELGRYDEALALLAGNGSRHSWLATVIATHAAAGNRALFGLRRVDGQWQPIESPEPQGHNSPST
ncbi:MAG: hypothetical protein ACKVP9_19390 [Burkholderiales bacterium]